MADEVVLYVTASSQKEAESIGRKLVEERLVACANIVPEVTSVFRWQGELCTEKEALLILKSVREQVDKIIRRVESLHSYEVPEVIALPIVHGSEAYLAWVREETRQNRVE